MARHASGHGPCPPRRHRDDTNSRSPNWRPDITLINCARDGNHVLADVTCPSVVTRAVLPAACRMPLATAIATTAAEHAKCRDVHPHTALPFVVDHEHTRGARHQQGGDAVLQDALLLVIEAPLPDSHSPPLFHNLCTPSALSHL